MSGLPDISTLIAQVGYSRLEWRVSKDETAQYAAMVRDAHNAIKCTQIA